MADKILSPEEWLAQQGGSSVPSSSKVMSPEEWLKHKDDNSYDMSEYAPPVNEGRLDRIKRLAKQTARESDTAEGAALLGGGEAALQAVTGLGSSIAGGLAGIAGSVLPGPQGQGARWSQAIQKAGTYEPKSSAGKLASAMVSEPMSWAAEKASKGAPMVASALLNRNLTPSETSAMESVGEASIPLSATLAGVPKMLKAGSTPIPEKVPVNLTEASTMAARKSGYAIPDDSIFTGIGGKIKTQQAASVKNQAVTNAKAARELGLPADTELSENAFTELHSKYGKPYAAASKLGGLDVTGVNLPKSVKVTLSKDPLSMSGADVATVDASELVRQWKQSNSDARGYYKAFSRDANPETQAKAFSAKAESDQMERLIRKVAKEKGTPELYDALKEARVKLAKVHNVESATNTATGNVDAAKVAKAKYLTGELKDIQKMQKIAPKSVKTPESIGANPAISPLDVATAGIEASHGGVSGIMGALSQLTGRPLARKYTLSDAYQKRLIKDTSGRNKSALQNLAAPSAATQQQTEEEINK